MAKTVFHFMTVATTCNTSTGHSHMHTYDHNNSKQPAARLVPHLALFPGSQCEWLGGEGEARLGVVSGIFRVQ